MKFHSSHLRIVLVRPRNPLNIAAAARAMMNLGFDDLSIVAPYEPVLLESKAAPGAAENLRSARVETELLPAIEDRTLVLGTSSLSRRQSQMPVFSLEQLEEALKDNPKKSRIALLFGSEKTGLRNEDLSFCQAIVRIPTSRRCPSMNLGQAVAICCYEMRRIMARSNTSATDSEIADHASIREIMRLADEIINLSNINSTYRESARSLRLRKVLLTLPLSSREVKMAMGFLRDLAWKYRKSEEIRSVDQLVDKLKAGQLK